MKSKKRILLTVIMVILLSSVSFWILRNNSNSTLRKELYDFAVQDTASITRVYLVNTSGKEITLEKKKPGDWTVNGKFKARNDAARNLLSCIKDLQVRQPVAKSAVENISKQLATNSTKVEIYSGEKLLKMYYVGSDTQDGLGTYMLLTDAETGENSILPFIMFIPGFNGYLSIRYFIDEDLWRDRSIFSFYPDQITSIDVSYSMHPDSSFSIRLSDQNDISIFDHKGGPLTAFDTLKAKRYITYYTNIQYESLENGLRRTLRDSILTKAPIHTIVLKDREGIAHTVKTYPKPADVSSPNPLTGDLLQEDPERMYALINEDKDLAVIQYYVFGKLFMPVSFFRSPPSPSVKK